MLQRQYSYWHCSCCSCYNYNCYYYYYYHYYYIQFLEGVSIACYAEPCISHRRVVRLSVHQSHIGSVKRHKLASQNFHQKFNRAHPKLGH